MKRLLVSLGLLPIACLPALAQSPVVVTGTAYSAPVTMQNAATSSVNGSSLVLNNGGSYYSAVLLNINCSVACSGGTTINFEGTDSTGTFFPISGVPVTGGGAVSSATTSGQFVIGVSGLVSVRARISGYSAGTITVTGVAIASGAGSSSGGGAGGSVSASQSGTWTVGVNNWGGTSLGAPSNYGTSPGAVAVPGTNAFVTNTPNVAATSWGGTTLGAASNYGTSPGAVAVPGVNSFVTNTPNVAATSWGGGTLGAMANYGTSPGAVLVPGVNAFVTNTPNVTTSLTTSGGYTTTFFQPAANDNHTNVKNGAGQVYWVLAENNSATVNYLRLYNAGSGFNGCNSATNLVTQIQIPASTTVGGINIALPYGLPFSTGISYCVTSGYATNDTTNATASAMSITIGYN